MRLHILPLVLACGCATDVASKADVRTLQEQVQSLQRENAQLVGRLDALEHDRQVVASRPEAAAPVTASVPAQAPENVAATAPALTVVKLKPKPAPPPLDLATLVQEPDPALLEELTEKAEPAVAAAPNSADQEYQAALEALRTGNVSGAVERLKRFAASYPKHPKADDALYYAALGEIGRGELARAAALLESLVQRYPAGDVVQDAMLKLGEVHVRLRQTAEARATYALLVETFPGTAAAVQAQARLSTLPRNP
ncbi:MAG: tetratricopeptide repeat protein [Myxococcaceae bacterium]